MNKRYPILVLVLLSVLVLAACSAPPAAPTTAPAQPTTVVQPTPAPIAASATVAATAPAQSTTASSPTSPATLAAKATAAPTTAAAEPASQPGTFGKADLDKIFPPGKGQDLVFQACVNCHNWVPIVLAGFDKNAWEQNKMNHRNRVSSLSDADFQYLYNYLEQTFPAGHPVPTNIPEDLLKEWTSY